MTDNELEQMHKTLLDGSEIAALRAVYNLGYLQGAGGLTPSVSMPDYSVVTPKPSDAVISTIKAHSQVKK
jgi:hypothetical protein